MAIVIKLNGNTQAVTAGLDSFVKQNGWTEKIANPDYDPEDSDSVEEIDNPVTKLDFANTVLTQYFGDNIRAWNIKQAEQAARNAAQAATDQALDTTTVEVTEE